MTSSNPLIDGRRADSARRRQRVIKAINDVGRTGGEISVSAIARAAGVDRTFLYRHADLLGQVHATQANPAAAQGDGPTVSRASLQADLANAQGQATRQAARIRQLETKLSQLLGEQAWRESGLPGRHRPAPTPDHRTGTAGGRPARPGRGTRPGTRRRTDRQPGTHRQPQQANLTPQPGLIRERRAHPHPDSQKPRTGTGHPAVSTHARCSSERLVPQGKSPPKSEQPSRAPELTWLRNLRQGPRSCDGQRLGRDVPDEWPRVVPHNQMDHRRQETRTAPEASWAGWHVPWARCAPHEQPQRRPIQHRRHRSGRRRR